MENDKIEIKIRDECEKSENQPADLGSNANRVKKPSPDKNETSESDYSSQDFESVYKHLHDLGMVDFDDEQILVKFKTT